MKKLRKLVLCAALLAAGAAQAELARNGSGMTDWIARQSADGASTVQEPGTLVLMSLAIGVLALIRGKRR